jgi:peroxiredoxin family protein
VNPALRKLAVRVTRGGANNLFQVATLVRAASALDVTVDVLFCDAALQVLHRGDVNDASWSDAYEAVIPVLEQRLHDAEFVTMEDFLRDAKDHGDAVRYLACSDTLAAHRIALPDLTALLDGEQSLESFLSEAIDSDALLSF